MSDRTKCPDCGLPTVPDREELTYDEMLCERCYADAIGKELDYNRYKETVEDILHEYGQLSTVTIRRLSSLHNSIISAAYTTGIAPIKVARWVNDAHINQEVIDAGGVMCNEVSMGWPKPCAIQPPEEPIECDKLEPTGWTPIPTVRSMIEYLQQFNGDLCLRSGTGPAEVRVSCDHEFRPVIEIQ